MSDEKLYVIQENVPICPVCNSGLKYNMIMQKFLCFHCGCKFKPTDHGQTEREFICLKEESKNVTDRNGN